MPTLSKRMWHGTVRTALLLAIVTSLGPLVALHARAAAPANCSDVKAANPSAADGAYQIVLDGAALTVYCADMSSTPQEYISLAMTAAGENFSHYTAGGDATGTDVRTSYTKLRINPVPVSTSPLTVAVDIADETFSSTTGSLSQGSTPVTSMPYAIAMACTDAFVDSGIANLDLRGTPFTIVNTFQDGGFLAAGTATVVSPQVVNLTGGGFCGWEAPAAEFNPFNMNAGYDLQLEVDQDVAVRNTPSNITTTATGASGAVVTYTTPTATDSDDTSTPAVACLPASGSMFAVGTTTVTCTATDPDDVSSVVTFTVTVMAAATPVPPTGSAPSALLLVLVVGAGVLLVVVAPIVAGPTRRRRIRRS